MSLPSRGEELLTPLREMVVPTVLGASRAPFPAHSFMFLPVPLPGFTLPITVSEPPRIPHLSALVPLIPR